jgi:hypothetical protein
MEGETMKQKITQQNYLRQRFKRSLWGVWIFLFFYNIGPSLSELNAAETEKIDRLESNAAETEKIDRLESKLKNRAGIGDLIEYVYQENPSIQVAREAWQATVESFRVTTGYPDPELMVTYYPEPLETRLGPQDWNASLSRTSGLERQSFSKDTVSGQIVQSRRDCRNRGPHR